MAGASCASELRKKGAEGSILLAGREPEPPYERPPLSKEYLRGEAERSDAYVNPPEWYAENEGIHYLRAYGNSDAIRADAEAARHVALIGGSYIATEVAASLTARGTK